MLNLNPRSRRHAAGAPHLLLAVLLGASCAPKGHPLVAASAPPSEGLVAPAPCARWGEPRQIGVIAEVLPELSGLAASRTRPGTLWAHNDSGDSARFFSLAPGGVTTEYILPGATNVDWEDLDVGPCPQGSCVYLADIGDNRARRSDYAVYRTAEPGPGDGGTSSVTWERFPFRYPAGERHNAEALMVHPTSGRVYVATKEKLGVASEVYRFPEPLDASREVTLERVAVLPVPTAGDQLLTAAAIHPGGRRLLLRMYNRLVELYLEEGASDFEAIFSRPAVEVPVAPEPQGEAVAYTADGLGYVTASERAFGAAAPLWESRCQVTR